MSSQLSRTLWFIAQPETVRPGAVTAFTTAAIPGFCSSKGFVGDEHPQVQDRAGRELLLHGHHVIVGLHLWGRPRLRPLVTLPLARAPATPDCTPAASVSAPASPAPLQQQRPKPPRLDRALLHQKTFGTDVLRCPCGGRRSIRAVHSTRKQAEARLIKLGVSLPSRVLPPATRHRAAPVAPRDVMPPPA